MFLDIFRQTLRTLWAHKLRSFLTMFGIAWGVGSLLLLIGLGEGFRSGNKRQLDTIGEDIMFMFGGRIPAVEGSHQAMKPFRLTHGDYLAVKEEARHLRAISPVLNRGDIRAASEFNSTNGQVFGVNANYDVIRYMPLAQGRWLNELDDQQQRRVAVLGDEMRRNLFPGRPFLGTTILLNGVRFEVIGSIEKMRGESSMTDMRVFIPYQTMRILFPLKDEDRVDGITYLNYRPASREVHDDARMEVRRIIARRKGGFDYTNDDNFWDWDTVKSQETIGKIFDAMNLFLGGVGLVTLALGAIGIINIMLVSVTERTREIGLRKALGATNRSILTQFFLEGAFLTLISGGVGIAAAAGFMMLLAQLPAPEGFDTPRLVPSSATVAVLALSFAGIVAGLYPARKAALMQPVEALRQE
ncbi:MAG TPA: ABC transporter permease [Terriglobales bacterium]|nr:ABC transporter permease [Terriglobales bacterium]